MKIINIYQKFFMQVWLFILSAVVFAFGILMLTDLGNYRLVITEGRESNTTFERGENDVLCMEVSIKCKTALEYFGPFDQIVYHGYNLVDSISGYKVKDYTLYLDVYDIYDYGNEVKYVFVETICAEEYSEKFYDPLHTRKVISRLENVKYEYPAWRIYVPIMIFVFTLPIMSLSGYLIAAKIIEWIKQKVSRR